MFKGTRQFKPMLDTLRKEIEARENIKPIAEFGQNYAEFFRDGGGATEKLLAKVGDYEWRAYKGEQQYLTRKERQEA